MELTKNNIKYLQDFEKIFLKWQKTINLVSKNSLSDLWNRHIMDSVQLYPYIKGKKILDLGSGGGFPALILAIIDKEYSQSKFFLVERDQRKCAFLKEVIRKFSLNAKVINNSIEQIKPFDFNIITSRALAEIEKLLTLSINLINIKTEFYLLKGKNSDLEIKNAYKTYDFNVKKIPSKTDTESWILNITNVKIKETL